MIADTAAAEAAVVVASARCNDLSSALFSMREGRRAVGDLLGAALVRGDATAPGVRVYRRKQRAVQRLDLAYQAALIERRLAQRTLAALRDLEAVPS